MIPSSRPLEQAVLGICSKTQLGGHLGTLALRLPADDLQTRALTALPSRSRPSIADPQRRSAQDAKTSPSATRL